MSAMTDLDVILDENERYADIERRELFGTSDPVAVVGSAARIATELARVVDEKGLYQTISGKKHVRVEGWTLLGSMLGVFPDVVWTHRLDDGWEARCEARTKDGTLVGSAESECMRSETRWAGKDDHALRSMAQTRAVSKALKMPLGFVFSMAGYETTPAEEMAHEPEPAPPPPEPAKPKPTDAQIAEIHNLLAALELAAPGNDWRAWCRDEIGGDFFSLDVERAHELITKMAGKLEEFGPPTGDQP